MNGLEFFIERQQFQEISFFVYFFLHSLEVGFPKGCASGNDILIFFRIEHAKFEFGQTRIIQVSSGVFNCRIDINFSFFAFFKSDNAGFSIIKVRFETDRAVVVFRSQVKSLNRQLRVFMTEHAYDREILLGLEGHTIAAGRNVNVSCGARQYILNNAKAAAPNNSAVSVDNKAFSVSVKR